MRITPVAALALVLTALIIFGRPPTTRAAEDRSISGTVFFDLNKNGQFDFGELPAPGRTVELSRFDKKWHHVDKVKSDANGFYRFRHIPFNVPSFNVGIRTDEETVCLTGDIQRVDAEGGGMLGGKTATPGTQVNLGVLPVAEGSITGTFTSDLNENGIRDAGEPPLKGWRVTADGSGMLGLHCHSEATTGADGAFHLAVNVERWNWFSVYPPSSVRKTWEWTAPTYPSGNAGSPGVRERPQMIDEGEHLDVMVHFSTGDASLSGFVFRDLDKDGIHDLTDPPLDCVIVEGGLQLSREVSGIGATVMNSTPTCMDGHFEFSHLEGGNYHLGLPAYLSLTEYYRPWMGRWITISGGQKARDFIIALQPEPYPYEEPAPTLSPAPPMPVRTPSPDTSIVMPVVGSESDRSNPLSTAVFLITMAGLASLSAGASLYALRSRRN